MRPVSLAVAFSLAASALAATTITTCHANNCLRAIRATKISSRSLDCSSYLKATVTPATITQTNFETISFTEWETTYLTRTNTKSATFTEDSYVTVTVTESFTSSITVVPASPPSKVKRQQTLFPSNIPAYASPCPDAAAYSSACECIGVTATTITLGAQSTTITSVISETTTLTQTYGNNVTVTTTELTVTRPITVATVTVTQAIATATATACILQLQNGLTGKYVVVKPAPDLGSAYDMAQFTTVRSQASRFIVSPSGNLLLSDGSSISGYRPFNTVASTFIFRNFSGPGSFPVVCSVSVVGVLTCTTDVFVEFGSYDGKYLSMASSGNNWSPPSGTGPITIQCLPWDATSSENPT